MLTKVRLDGVLGKKFGKEWELDVSSPSEALRMIEANQPGLRAWLSENVKTYDGYQVTCVYENGKEEELNDATYSMPRNSLTMIRFTPVMTGSSSTVKMIVGAIIIAADLYFTGGSSGFWKVGAALMLGGIVEALSPRPKMGDYNSDSISSYYFDGPANTDAQGSPVPLIYGRVLVGSHPISASITVDEMM